MTGVEVWLFRKRRYCGKFVLVVKKAAAARRSNFSRQRPAKKLR
jgi:hypothetical protein